VLVGLGQRHDHVDVGLRVVVAEHRLRTLGRVPQVAVAATEVVGGGERGVVDVVRVLAAVAVAVAATACQLDGMNCIGPTARSYTGSPSRRPSSVSRIRATPGRPSSGMPRMRRVP